MREIEVKPNTILLEPIGRNTCPAITLAALKAVENNNDPIILVLSSDHHIDNTETLLRQLKWGLNMRKKIDL